MKEMTRKKCSCGNEDVQDFSGYGASSNYVVHLYCRECGTHFYKGKIYSAKAWELFVEA